MISRDEVRHVAVLARLRFDEDEERRLQEELSKIIDYVRQIGELDLSGVVPTAHAVAVSNVFRPDEPWRGLDKEQALANAPDVEQGCFSVPRMGA